MGEAAYYESGERATGPTGAGSDGEGGEGDGDVLAPAELRRMRVAAGLAQRELGFLVSYSRQAVGQWEAGTRAIPAPMHLALVEACVAARRERDLRRGRVRAGYLALVALQEMTVTVTATEETRGERSA